MDKKITDGHYGTRFSTDLSIGEIFEAVKNVEWFKWRMHDSAYMGDYVGGHSDEGIKVQIENEGDGYYLMMSFAASSKKHSDTTWKAIKDEVLAALHAIEA